MTSRRSFLKQAGSAILATAVLPLTQCARETQKTNIIYILADDLGYGDLGCYGQKEIQTPNIDRMASEGMLFTDHYAGCTVCAPSRCTLMTGKHTGHARIRGNKNVPLRPEDTTVAEILKSAGYTTGLIGKWGLGDNESTGAPNKKGFDYFYGYLSQVRAHNYYPDWLWENTGKVYLDNKEVFSPSGYAKGVGSASTNKVTYSHDLFSEKALSFIDENQQNPFFLYLAYTIPHANDEWELVPADSGMEVPDYGIYKDKAWPAAQKGQAAMITRMDRDIGRIIGKLKEFDLDQNTLVMFTSDNGPHAEGGNDPDFNDSNGPLRGIKRDMYEGGIRVPMIARWPNTIKPGTRTDLVSAFWDVLPTCAEMVGVTPPADIDGISFLPTLKGETAKQKKHDYLYWEFHWWEPTRFAIRQGNWKAVKDGPDADIELYDLSSDISEQVNVAAEHPDKVSEMEKLFKSARTDSEDWPLDS